MAGVASQLLAQSRRKKPIETPVESFERLRQCFDVIKECHTDPWCWHEYLNEKENEIPEEEAEEDDPDDDPEQVSLRPRKRNNAEKLKTHLLACISEMIRASQAADMCYYHIATSPKDLKDCVIVLGTSGDVDEEMLRSGDASPQKILAALQEKLNVANAHIADLNEYICQLKERLADTQSDSDERWRAWHNAQMRADEAMMRLHLTTEALIKERKDHGETQAAYNKLNNQHMRASRLMVYRSREVLRRTFMANKKENMFYAFHGMIYILTEQKKERIRREQEARRDAIEFSLKNEVRFLLAEIDRKGLAVEMLTDKTNKFKKDRRALACRIMHKMRPYERLEYCLWAWELWISLREYRTLKLEKALENKTTVHAALLQHLGQVSQQVPVMSHRLDVLNRELAEERTAHDITKRQMMLEGSRSVITLMENLREHRLEEITVLRRLHDLDCEQKDERIAVLEREIAEDKHIHALKGMVLDLETRLRKALDRRKPKGYVVPPDAGMKCSVCSQSVLTRCWKKMPQVPELGPPSPGMKHSLSDADLTAYPAAAGGKSWQMATSKRATDSPFSAVWRS